MEHRPKCIIEGCQNLAKHKRFRKDGSHAYAKLCSTHYRNKYQKSIVKICPYCKNQFIVYDKRQIYCSKSCASFVKGKARKTYKTKNPYCECCGFNYFNALCVHHLNKVDRKSKMVLCANCHMVLHNEIGFVKFKELTKEESINIIKHAVKALKEV